MAPAIFRDFPSHPMETGTVADPSMAPLMVVGTVAVEDLSLAPQVEAVTMADKCSQGTAEVIGNIPFQGKLFIGGVERERERAVAEE